MKIFITGATGFVGKNVIPILQPKSEIYALTRESSASKLEEFKVNLVKGNLFNLQNAYKLKDIDVIIHIAGITKSLYEHEYFKINARGTYEIIKFAKEKKVKHFILISSLAAAGPSKNSSPLNEDTPVNPVSNYGLSKLFAEIYLKKSGLTYTIIRPPAIFGPFDKDIFTYFQMVKKGITLTSGDKKKLYSLVYVKDLANAIDKTVLNYNAFNETFFICYKQAYTIFDILNSIENAMQKRRVNINLPDIFTNLIFYPMQFYYILSGAPPLLNRDKLREIKQKFWICSPEKSYDKLQISPKYTLEKAMQETAKWYVANKWL